MNDIDYLKLQLKNQPDWVLRLLSGQGALVDRLRYKVFGRSIAKKNRQWAKQYPVEHFERFAPQLEDYQPRTGINEQGQ